MPKKQEPRFLDLFDVRRFVARTRSGVDVPIQIGFLLLVVLVGASAWLNHHHTTLVHDEAALVARSQHVVAQVQGVLAELATAESAVHGYALTGSEVQLEPYERARESAIERLADLLLVTDGGELQSRVEVLQMRAQLRIGQLDETIARARGGVIDPEERLRSTQDGLAKMRDVRDAAEQVQGKQGISLVDRERAVSSSLQAAQTTGLALGAAGVFLVVLVYNMVRRFERLRDESTREIADARERFQVALGSIGDAVLVVDAEGRLAFCNEGCRSLMRIGQDEIGRPLEDFVTSIAESSGEAREFVFRRALSERGVHRTAGDAAIRLADGTLVPVDATAASIAGQDGVTQGAVLVMRDISERRERERELARSNERFRSLVLATAQVVWTTDADGQVREDSPSWRKLTGQTYEQWKGYGGFDAVHPEDRERVVQAWKAAVSEKRPFAFEYRLRMADGGYRWSMARAVPVVDVDGTIREWVGMNRDIHQRKESDAAQRSENRRKDEFIALLAHEIRNPLAPLRNGLEVLKAGQEPEASRALEMMDRQVRHMVRLIDDLLDVSRISQGKLDLRLERIDLRDILRQSVEVVLPAVEGKNQRLSVSLPPAPMWVEGDPVRLTQIVVNLLSNAVKYSGEEASIWLTADREGTHHVVNVRDTGQGIPTELRPRIWDLFLQGGGRLEREGGLGIGLTLVKRLVELHLGSVEVQSEGLGAGSEFVVRLPASTAKSERAGHDPAAPARSAARVLRILVVDDNEDSAESLSMLLRIGGHAVRTAFRGDDGIVECARFAPELVLCDIRMPDMTGYEVAQRLRAIPEGKSSFLVALTGFGADADREASVRAGFDRHLVKPVDPESLELLVLEAARGLATGAKDGTAAP